MRKRKVSLLKLPTDPKCIFLWGKKQAAGTKNTRQQCGGGNFGQRTRKSACKIISNLVQSQLRASKWQRETRAESLGAASLGKRWFLCGWSGRWKPQNSRPGDACSSEQLWDGMSSLCANTVTSTLPPQPLQWQNRPAWAVLCSVKSWWRCQGSAAFSGVAEERRAQTLSAVQWEGRLVTCLRVLSLASRTTSVLRGSFLFVRTALQQEAVTCRINTFYSLNLRSSQSALSALTRQHR